MAHVREHGRTFNNHDAYWLFPIEDGAVVVPANSNRLVLLNSSALFIWNRWRSGQDASEIARNLALTYRIADEIAISDTAAAIAQYESLIVAAAEPASRKPRSSKGRHGKDTVSQIYAINGRCFRLILRGGALRQLSIRFENYRCSSSEVPETTFEVFEAGDTAVVERDGEYVCCEPVQSASITLLEMIAQHCSTTANWLACIHAGAIAAENHCVVLAGASSSGKSTLIAAIVHAGYKLISDDIVGIEAGRLSVSGLPLPIKLREGSWPLLERFGIQLRDAPIHSIHNENTKLLFPVGATEYNGMLAKALIFIRLCPDFGSSVMHRLSAIESLQRLHDAGFWVKPDKTAIAAFLQWLQTVTLLELTFPNLDAAIPPLQAILQPV